MDSALQPPEKPSWPTPLSQTSSLQRPRRSILTVLSPNSVVLCLGSRWTKKNVEHQRVDAFKLWCWRRFLRVPWTARRSSQSFLKEIHPEQSLEGPMLKPKLQYFGHLMRRTDSLAKTLMLEKIEGRRRGQQRKRWLDRIVNSTDMSLSELQMVEDREA